MKKIIFIILILILSTSSCFAYLSTDDFNELKANLQTIKDKGGLGVDFNISNISNSSWYGSNYIILITSSTSSYYANSLIIEAVNSTSITATSRGFWTPSSTNAMQYDINSGSLIRQGALDLGKATYIYAYSPKVNINTPNLIVNAGEEYGNNYITTSITFEPNGEDVNFINNAFIVYNLSFYYDSTYFINLGTISNAENYNIYATFSRISEPQIVNGEVTYHNYEFFNNGDGKLFVTGKEYVDIYNYALRSGNFYVLNLSFYENDTFVDNINTYYYINGVPSGDWLIVRSGDKLYSPDNQTNTMNIIQAINDNNNNLYKSGDSGDKGIIQKVYDDLFTLSEDKINIMLSDFIADNGLDSGEVAVAKLGFDNLKNSGDFIISWNNIDTPYFKLSGDSINFSAFVRENDTLSNVMNYVHHILGISLLLMLAHNIFKTLLATLGIADNIFENTKDEQQAVESVTITTDKKGNKTTTRTLKSGNVTLRWLK